jgi:hypothetical protein
MAFNTTTPVSPWTTGVGGSGTWAELVTFINNPAIISQAGQVYTITGLIDITATMTPLQNSVIICKGGGSYSVGNGGSVTFGRQITTPSGQLLSVDGCLLIDDTDCYQRGVDNYTNTKAMARTGSSVTWYATTFINRTSGRSDFDIQSGGSFKAYDCRLHLQAGLVHFDHYAGIIDIDGLVTTHANDTGGALVEIMSTSSITKINNLTPYLNNAASRQCTLWNGNVIMGAWGGDNFAPWHASGYYRLDDPKTTTLKYVDNYGSAGLSACERRTAEFLCLSSAGVVPATVTVINNVDELEGEGVANATTGLYTTKVKRTVFPGGTGGPQAGYARTPQIVYARKWGYKTYSTSFLANPTGFGQSKITGLIPMVNDSNITLTSTQAAAIQGVTIEKHGKAVNWNGKDFSITVTVDTTKNLTISQIYQSIAYQCSELNTILPRAFLRTNNNTGNQFRVTWAGANGDSDLTFVVVHASRPDNQVFGSQIGASIGTATAGLSLRTHTTRGMVFQNYTTDLFPDTSYTAPKLQYVNPDGGNQLMISVGRYDSVAKKVNVWTNNAFYAEETQTIDRGAGASYMRIFGQGDSYSWEPQYHQMGELIGFSRRLSDAEVSQISMYLAKKWHHMAVGNIVPGGTNAITAANFPVNASGKDWTPADYANGQGPTHWFSMADSADYTLNGSNLNTIKDKVTGTFYGNQGGWGTIPVVQNYTKLVLPQLLDTLTSTTRSLYPDGRYYGVRIVDQNGNAYLGYDKMMADDGTYYYPPVSYTLTLTGLQPDSEIRLYRVSDNVELTGVETVGSTTYSYTYVYSQNIPCTLVIFSLGYKPIFLPLTLAASSSTVPIQQTLDRNFENL